MARISPLESGSLTHRQNVLPRSVVSSYFCFHLFDSWLSTSVMTLPCCVCPLRPLWTLTSSWPLCLPLARSCPTITSATSPDGDASPVSWSHDPSVWAPVCWFQHRGWVFSVKLNVTYVSNSAVSSWWQPVLPAEAGPPSSDRPQHLHQKWLVGQHRQDQHGVRWWWCWGWMQCESPPWKSCTLSNWNYCKVLL